MNTQTEPTPIHEPTPAQAPRLHWKGAVVGAIIGAAIISGKSAQSLDVYEGASIPQPIEQQHPDFVNGAEYPKHVAPAPEYPKFAVGPSPAPGSERQRRIDQTS